MTDARPLAVRVRARPGWLPTRLLLGAALVPVLAAVAAIAVPAAANVLLALDALLLAACVLDWRRIPRAAFVVERETPSVFAAGRANVVTVTLRNRTSRRFSVELNEDLFDGATAEELPARLEIGPFESATVKYSVVPARRGAFALGDHIVRYTTAPALLVRQERIAASDEVRVYPDVLALRQYDAWARLGQDPLLGSSIARGGESEFERLRAYTRDDEYRHIDWRATARRRALTVRQFQTETEQSVFVLLDAGRTMRAEAQGVSFLDHALNAALMLAHVAITRGDRVGLLAFDSVPRAFVAAASGASAERAIIRATFDLATQFTEPDFAAAFAMFRTRVRRRSLVVLFTQLIDARAASQLAPLLRSLVPRHLPLCVLLRDRDVDSLVSADVNEALDLYVRGAAADAVRWREQLVRQLRAAGVLVLDVYPEQLTPQLVRRYVEIKAHQLL